MTKPSAAYGVHSEVGTLRKVLVCSPGLAHERLTPTNCDDLFSTMCCGCRTPAGTISTSSPRCVSGASTSSNCTMC